MDDRDASTTRETVNENEATYELYYCLYDLMSLYAKQHEVCYGQKLPGLDRSLADLGQELRRLEQILYQGS